VGAQRLDPEPPDAIVDRVQQPYISYAQPAAQPALQPQQQPGPGKIPERFVEERRMKEGCLDRVCGGVSIWVQAVLLLDPHAERQAGWTTVGLLVEKVAPAPDRLGQQEARHTHVDKLD